MCRVQGIYIAYRLLKEMLHRVTGIRRDASLPTVVFASGMLAAAFGPVVAPVLRLFRRPSHPSFASTMMGAAVARYAARSIGGDKVEDTPFAGAIIAGSAVAPMLHLLAVPVQMLRSAWGAFVRALERAVPRERLPL